MNLSWGAEPHDSTKGRQTAGKCSARNTCVLLIPLPLLWDSTTWDILVSVFDEAETGLHKIDSASARPDYWGDSAGSLQRWLLNHHSMSYAGWNSVPGFTKFLGLVWLNRQRWAGLWRSVLWRFLRCTDTDLHGIMSQTMERANQKVLRGGVHRGLMLDCASEYCSSVKPQGHASHVFLLKRS